MAAAVAAVLALALGWMLGRATTGGPDVVADDGPDAGRVTTTTAATPFATLPIVGEEIEGADFDEPAVEERSRSEVASTTTEPTGPTVEPVAVDERLAGVPVRLVGVELGGVLVEVDLASGLLTDFRARPVIGEGTPLVVGPDWVLLSSGGPSRVIRSDGTETPLALGDGWQILHLPGTELFWRTPSTGPIGDEFVLTLVDLDGEPVGPELELPVNTWPFLVDPATGGVVVGNAPRHYVVTPDGVEYLGIGTIIGLTDAVLVTFDCDEAFVCALRRIDRSSGEIAVVPSDPDRPEPYRWDSLVGWGGSGASTVSPDGRWVAVIGSSWRSALAGIVELGSGRFVELARDSYPPTVAWSADSRWAFALDDGEVIAYDTVTGERFPAFTDTVRWTQLGVRPLVPPTDEPEPGAEGATLLRVGPGTTRDGEMSGVAEETVEG